MLSMMKALAYYLRGSRMMLAFVLVFAFCCSVEAIAVWMHFNVPWFAELGVVVGLYDGVPSLMVWGSSFVAGSFLAMAHAIFMAAITSELFKRGYVKNLIQAKGGRATLALSLVAWCVLSASVATLMGVAVTELGTRLAGCAPALPSLADFLQWFIQVTLCVSAYSVLTVMAVLLTKSEVAGMVIAISLGAGGVENILRLLLANIPGLAPALRDCLDGYLAADLSMLGSGAICDPFSYVQSIATIAVATALCVAVAKKRSFA